MIRESEVLLPALPRSVSQRSSVDDDEPRGAEGGEPDAASSGGAPDDDSTSREADGVAPFEANALDGPAADRHVELREDLHAGARWLQEGLPFILLLLFVFVQNNILSIVEIGWLVYSLNDANKRMRKQMALKEARAYPLLLLGAAVASNVALLVLMEGGAHLAIPHLAVQ